jgi:hypothetical protein
MKTDPAKTLDPVAMGRGIVKTFDSVTMFAFRAATRGFLSRKEQARHATAMAFDKDQIAWAADSLAGVFKAMSPKMRRESSLAFSLIAPLAIARIMDAIDRALVARAKDAKKVRVGRSPKVKRSPRSTP